MKPLFAMKLLRANFPIPENVLVSKTFALFDLVNPPKECKNYMVICTCGLQKQRSDVEPLAIGTVTECTAVNVKRYTLRQDEQGWVVQFYVGECSRCGVIHWSTDDLYKFIKMSEINNHG